MLVTSNASAQYDEQFTQYMYNEMFINPAYAGSHDFISSVLLYRNQWTGIEGAPKTQTFSIHSPVKSKNIGVGLSVLNEKIGITKLFTVNGTFAYKLPVTYNSILSFGLSGGVGRLQEDYSDLDCCGGATVDPLFLEDTPGKSVPRAGFGIYYSDSSNFYVGWSVPRLIESAIDPLSDNSVVSDVNMESWHHYIAAGYVFDLNQKIKLKPTIMIKTVHGSPVEFDLNINALLDKKIWVGSSYRTGDAIALLTSYQFTPKIRLGYSYDFNICNCTDLNIGSHEFTLGYDFIKDYGIKSIRYF
ncbi:MAG: type IX secretion system membrane protein PorP/SprF [Bacteroidia bacterium]|nr:type IX secretion system membrane protein PorP/SprF [Bacteroidia bacterium]NNM16578.1 type IX secretion system membrane protein PorP/SprF [Bacteroidia bacterium]